MTLTPNSSAPVRENSGGKWRRWQDRRKAAVTARQGESAVTVHSRSRQGRVARGGAELTAPMAAADGSVGVAVLVGGPDGARLCGGRCAGAFGG